MVELFISGHKADLSEGTTIALTAQAIDLTQPTAIKCGYSKSIVLEGTPRNNEIFGELYLLDRESIETANFDPRKRNDFKLINNGDIITTGYLQLDSIKREKDRIEYSITLFGALADFFYSLMYFSEDEIQRLRDEGITDYNEGDEKTFDSLYLGLTDDDGNVMTRRQESEYTVVWDEDFVLNSWKRLANHSKDDRSLCNWVTAAPVYNGLAEDFDSNKCLVNTAALDTLTFGEMFPTGVTKDDTTYTAINDWTLEEMGREMNEYEMRDLRVEYQRPAFKLELLFDAILRPENNGGYTVRLDPDFYDPTTPLGRYYKYSYCLVNGIDWKEENARTGSEEDITLDSTITVSGGTAATGEFSGQDYGDEITINFQPQVYISDTHTGGKFYTNDDYIVGETTYIGGFLYYTECYDKETGAVLRTSNYNACTITDKGDGQEFKGLSSVISTMWNLRLMEAFNLNSSAISLTANRLTKTGSGTFAFDYQFTSRISVPTDTDAEYGLRLTIIPFKLQGLAGIVPLTITESYKSGVIKTHAQHAYSMTVSNANLTAVRNGEAKSTAFGIKKINKKSLWGNGATAFDYLTSFTKLFDLRYLIDREQKKVSILQRKRFYLEDIVDIDERIDRNRAIEITPTTVEKKWYNYGLEIPETYASYLYDKKNTIPYGWKRYNTGYYFNNDEENLFDGSTYKQVIPYNLKSIYFNLPDIYDPFYEKDLPYPIPALGTTYKHILFRDEGDSIDTYEEVKYGLHYTTPLKEKYDSDRKFPKLCCFDKDSKPVEGIDYTLAFFDGYYKTDKPYTLSHNLPIMSELNDGTPCYIYTMEEKGYASKDTNVRETINRRTDILPVFSKCLTDENSQQYVASFDFDLPSETFGETAGYGRDITIYGHFWRDYISDLYHKDSKSVRLYYFLTGNIEDALRCIYKFDNALWILNEVTDYIVGSTNPTLCTFVKINDRYNYTQRSTDEEVNPHAPIRPDIDYDEVTYEIDPTSTDLGEMPWSTTGVSIAFTGIRHIVDVWGDERTEYEDVIISPTFSTNTSKTESRVVSGETFYHDARATWQLTQTAVPFSEYQFDTDPAMHFAVVEADVTGFTFVTNWEKYAVYEDGTREYVTGGTETNAVTFPENTGSTQETRTGTITLTVGAEVPWTVVQKGVTVIGEPLCFEPDGNEAITVRLRKGYSPPYTVSLQTSTDKVTWTHYSLDDTITVPVGGKVYFRNASETNTHFSKDYNHYYYFVVGNGTSKVSGDVTTLISKYGTDTLSEGCFSRLFTSCQISTAPALPATTLAGNCYLAMFERCASLVTAPELPATTLADGCYYSMFEYCTALTTAPELPATTLAAGCYFRMFYDCTSLTTAPELPATTLANSCYKDMFQRCTSLTSAPELPATTLADYCYKGMFQRCTALTTAPELPATTIADECYYEMFRGCTSLTTAPSELPATTLADTCYASMFYDCTSLTTAPELPATTLKRWCYDSMFYGCTSLNYVKCLAAYNTADSYTYQWLKYVAATGTFVKASSATWSRYDGGIPVGWTVEDA